MNPAIHRPLPQSPDAEKGVLSAFMQFPAEVGDYLHERGITTGHFHLPAHAILFGTILTLWQERRPFDMIVICDRLRERGQLEPAGGPAGIAEIFTFTCTSANIAEHTDIVERKHTLRQIIQTCTDHATRAYSEQDDADGLLAGLEKKVLGIAASRHQDAGQSVKDLVMEAIHDIESAHQAKTGMKALPTGIRELDDETGGIGDQEFVVLQAERSHGKTSLALTLAAHYAIDLRIPTGYISLETPAKMLTKRIIASRARVSITALLRGQMERPEGFSFGTKTIDPFAAVTAAATQLADAPLHFEYQRGLMATEIAAKVRRMTSKHGVRIVFIDFLQKMGEDKRQSDKRSDRIAANSLALSNICGDQGIAVVVLSQENNDGQAFGSSEIANDADLQIAIHTEDDDEFELVILKQKDGERNQRIPVWFDKACTAFRNIDERPAKPAAPGAGKKTTRAR